MGGSCVQLKKFVLFSEFCYKKFIFTVEKKIIISAVKDKISTEKKKKLPEKTPNCAKK